jgi:hypothetical protein
VLKPRFTVLNAVRYYACVLYCTFYDQLSLCSAGLLFSRKKSGVYFGCYMKPYPNRPSLFPVTLLGNILLRSIVVSVLIRLINGYSVTDGT